MTEPPPNRALMVVLAYLWPLALIPLLLEKDDAETQWHAKHGLVLMVVEIVLLVAFGMFTSVISLATFGIGCVLAILTIFLCIAILAVHVMAIIRGLNGGRFVIRGISEYADRF